MSSMNPYILYVLEYVILVIDFVSSTRVQYSIYSNIVYILYSSGAEMYQYKFK